MKAALLRFMLERHQIFLRRQAGQPAPWTKDPILQAYRFTNVYRELDRTTIWIREHIREPFAAHPNLWFMLCIARQINYPPTLSELIQTCWPVKEYWSPERCAAVMRARASRGEVVYSPAYLLVGGTAALNPRPRDKPEFTTKHVLLPMWHDRAALEPELHITIQHATCALSSYFAWGGFLAYEVVCDLRYTRYLKHAPDKTTWANAGPGALRGLNRTFGRPHEQALQQAQALDEMRELWSWLTQRWKFTPPLELREVEHSLCEFDKYERARLGQGKPRQLFRGAAT